jgi:uncharacterized protein (TIGR00251 family)
VAKSARICDDGLLVFLRLTPRSFKDEVTGIDASNEDGAHISARVRAVPENGAANKALVKLFARWLGVPKSGIRVRTGAASRMKTLHVSGDPELLMTLLENRLRNLRSG